MELAPDRHQWRSKGDCGQVLGSYPALWKLDVMVEKSNKAAPSARIRQALPSHQALYVNFIDQIYLVEIRIEPTSLLKPQLTPRVVCGDSDTQVNTEHNACVKVYADKICTRWQIRAAKTSRSRCRLVQILHGSLIVVFSSTAYELEVLVASRRHQDQVYILPSYSFALIALPFPSHDSRP